MYVCMYVKCHSTYTGFETRDLQIVHAAANSRKTEIIQVQV